MIISASKKTDIPAFYPDWFLKRIIDGAFYTANDEKKRYYKWQISPENVEAIVFWSKNPKPIMPTLSEIGQRGYPCLFNFTLTPYSNKIEKGIVDKREVLRTFIELSNEIGADKVVWHYAPIFINSHFTVEYHQSAFEKLAKILSGYTEECKITFIKDYIPPANATLFTKRPKKDEALSIVNSFIESGNKYNIKISSCMEGYDNYSLPIEKLPCVSKKRIETLTNKKIIVPVNEQNEKGCLCLPVFDVGVSSTCMHNCEYCYEKNNSVQLCKRNYNKNTKNSLLLCSDVNPDYKVKKMELRRFTAAPRQMSLFD